MPEAEHAKDRSARAQARFLEYSATGRPDALAEVFDLCAPELLLVAHHVAAPGVPAEDLIQQTFLVAIQNAERFDGMRPLMPWLCGILVNVARAANRRSRRSDAVAARPELERDDPAEVAQARELAAETLRAIDDLPARQREVLTLRLVHGLTPTEIAHALREPVGTVKSWIHRGVERLRTLLPAGFAAALVYLVGGERSLASAKEAVLHEAALLQPTVGARIAGSFTRGVRHASASWFGVALVLVVGALGWNALRTAARTPDGAPAATHAAAPSVETSVEASPEREAVRTTSTKPATASSLRIRARGEDGEPARIAVRLTPRFGAEPDFRAIERTTDAAGELSIADLEPGGYDLLPDRAPPRTVEIGAGSHDIEIELANGATVEGRVVDASATPIAGARVWLSGAVEPTRGFVVAVTDPAGRFVVADVPASRSLSILADGYAPPPLRPVGAELARGDAETIVLDFVLTERSSPIEGDVVDASGAPLAGALVQIGSSVDRNRYAASASHATQPAQVVVTDSVGRFRVESASAADVRVWARAPGFEVATAIVAHATTGIRPLRLSLTRGATWAGAVEAPANVGVHLESRASIVVRASVDDVPPAFAWPRMYLDPNRAFRVTGLPPGAQALVATSTDGASTQRDVVLARDEVVDWSPRLDAEPKVTGLALDEAGNALVGFRAVVVDAEGRSAFGVVGADGRFTVAIAISGRGIAWLHGPADGYPGTLTHRLLPLPPGEELVLRASESRRPSAVLRARAFDEDGSTVTKLRATSAADGTIVRGEVGADGFTSFPPLPPGDYYLTLAGDVGTRLIHGPITLGAGARVALDDVRVPASGRVRARIDPASDGPRSRTSCRLTTTDGAFVATYFVVERGEAESLPVPAGRYVCDFSGSAFEPVVVDVLPHATVDVTLHAAPLRPAMLAIRNAELCGDLRLHVRWTRESASPAAANDRLQLLRVANGVDGVVGQRAFLRPGSYRVDVRSCEGLRGSATVEVTDTGPEPIVDIVLE